jgi:phosphoglycerate dehydrogenase-like enzyme
VITVLNQLDDGVSTLIEESVENVQAITLPPSGAMPPDVSGDVLLIPRRSENWEELVGKGISWVHVAGAGAEGIPTELLDGITVTCSRGAYAVPMAEYVLAALLAAEKGLPSVWLNRPPEGPWGDLGSLEERAAEYDSLRPWEVIPENWGFVPSGTLVNRVVSIVGFGEVGQEIAKRLLPFGSKVLGVRRSGRPSEIQQVEIVPLDDALSLADHVVLAAPATPETRHLIARETLEVMKRGSHLVNVARGSLVNQDDLLHSLDQGHLGLATLDTVDPEPLPSGHPFYAHPRVRLTPHISWCSPTRQRRVAEVFVEELQRYVRGDPLLNVVDLKAGY